MATEQIDSQNIRYTLDGSVPQVNSPYYTGPFVLNRSTRIAAQYFLDSIAIGPSLIVDTDIHKAIGKPVKYNS
ncbi:FN3 associated domain-containing protein [Sphingobacterium luzhongxinii]|uniref:FN3 associated domain-containing protein n=1 Tax=Sphingobacterium TaxID=28453 RepID=UPI0013DA967E